MTMIPARVPAPAADETSHQDDAALARRIVAGDRSAFEQLMRRYNRRLYRLARATLRDDAEAEDALQDAYLSAFSKMAQFRGEAALSTWLSRLVLNECLGRLRRSARRDNVVHIVVPDADEELDTMGTSQTETPDRAAMRAEVRCLLERKLDELPQDFRAVFVLRCVEELSVEETAAVLGVPETTVRTRHFRARGLLRESLAQEIDLAERDLFEFGGLRCDRIVDQVMRRLPA
ncbi:MAG TPA: RNA polymerase sigma factor [Caldimonas sp.]|jgi:RNA polymerase sigma-70 factor (ECF subfamily)|nr:RNA polymerase sigma factor [Caldimonas sp.]HEX2542459.1 RNA polymerase sigma factor [Caldimonas sp.]